MKSFGLVLIILVEIHSLASSPLDQQGKPIEISPNTVDEAVHDAQWFDQKLDHFDESNNETWKQRYYYYDYYYQQQRPAYPAIPLFVIIGGETNVSDGGYTTNSPMYHLGIDYRALVMHLEHRFYGESKPTANLSTENLKYLSSRQAIEDIIYFTDKMKEKFEMKCHNEVVLFGGSYAGALAAWARYKYPHKISVAHASGAPIHAVFDFSGYNNVVKNSIELYDENCASVIQQGATKQQELMKTEERLKNISEKFKTCRKLEKDVYNKRAFFEKQLSTINNVVQYNGTLKQNIPDMCRLLTDSEEKEPIDKLANYIINTTITEENITCTGYNYHANIEDLKKTEWRNGETSRQFLWQECTELGYFRTSNKDGDLFANTLDTDFYTTRCRDVFGEEFTPENIKKCIDETNSYYGGKDYRQSNCLFTQGQLDPWQAAGITQGNEEQGYKALTIKNMGHVRDQATETPNDPPELVEAREEINTILKGWIKAIDFKHPPAYMDPLNCEENW